jgi:hypothetical protein
VKGDRFYISWTQAEERRTPNFCVADVMRHHQVIAEFVEEEEAREYCRFKNGR